MFKREHHVRIATVLQLLDSDLLLRHRCYFGGGTAITLARGEYRESVDIDFLVSDKAGFRQLRQALTGEAGIASIVRPGSVLTLGREIRADQYGIRTFLSVGGVEIKFEIVLEGRIELEVPIETNRICGVARLTDLDMAATKILANSDRWTDDSVWSRDLIDLAMLQLPPSLLKRAMEKAKSAYADAAERDLEKAIDKLKQRPGRLRECLQALKMDSIPEAVVWSYIRALR